MIPILYAAEETDFQSNGMGGLPDAISCSVEEELNGIYQLTLEYPADGLHADELIEGNIIMASHDSAGDLQPFRIYQRTDFIEGKFTVIARHLSYDLSRIPVMPFTSISPYVALQKLKENAAVTCPFDFDVDFYLNYGYAFFQPKSVRAILLETDTGGDWKGMIDWWHCDFKFDGWTVYVTQRRGIDTDISIRYGVNMTGLEVVSETREGFNAVVPFYSPGAALNPVVCDPPVVKGNSAYDYLGGAMVLDLTDQFEEAPTPQELETAAVNWLAENEPWITERSITISFVELGKTEDYKDFVKLQGLALGDSVMVYPGRIGARIGYGTRFRLVHAVYDVLRERYTETTLGRQPETLSSIVAKSNLRLQGVIDTSRWKHA